MDDTGDYFHINGEYVAPLNKRLIAKAVSAASAQAPRPRESREQRHGPPPVVTVRRKRTPIFASQDASSTGDS